MLYRKSMPSRRPSSSFRPCIFGVRDRDVECYKKKGAWSNFKTHIALSWVWSHEIGTLKLRRVHTNESSDVAEARDMWHLTSTKHSILCRVWYPSNSGRKSPSKIIIAALTILTCVPFWFHVENPSTQPLVWPPILSFSSWRTAKRLSVRLSYWDSPKQRWCKRKTASEWCCSWSMWKIQAAANTFGVHWVVVSKSLGKYGKFIHASRKKLKTQWPGLRIKKHATLPLPIYEGQVIDCFVQRHRKASPPAAGFCLQLPGQRLDIDQRFWSLPMPKY